MEVEIIDLCFQGLEGGIASFLVTGPEGCLLVETGPESTRETLLAALGERGIAPRDLAGIFLTHIHLDHAGAAGWFAREGVEVHVHERGARHLVDPSRLVESARGVYGERFDSLWGDLVAAPAAKVHALRDGEEVKAAGLVVSAVETPGHAFHHHAYRIDGAVFAGDAAGARMRQSDFLSVTSAPSQFHLEHTLASLGKLREFADGTLFLTHFGAVPDAAEHLEAYRDAVELNAEFVRQRLREGFEGEALAVAYEAFQLEQAFRSGLPSGDWPLYEAINGSAMCAEGMRLYWERRFAEET